MLANDGEGRELPFLTSSTVVFPDESEAEIRDR